MTILSNLEDLVNNRANEQDLQRELKKDLYLLAKPYASSTQRDEYICFSELPVGTTGEVDFAVFTGRSSMDIYLIEVKGADFNLVKNPTEKGATFNAKFLEGIDQIIRRRQYALSNDLLYRKEVHDLRELVQAGTQKYNSLLCNQKYLEVDRTKPINVYGVVIGGRHNPEIKHIEDEKRKAWRDAIGFPILLESWDSWLKKVR
ncbi:Shedu anti-phage system protein SduA domain-containing protein [Bacillus cereus]|uniref:Shedu anti-phage system protein SduA domain-containing protein n=1 Tax=Bacillus cereus TaxID=1396 RepID=UPI00159BDBAA|nr:Shedu anti-phage system protein SduA domain-containing protein [Bacillus cereus]